MTDPLSTELTTELEDQVIAALDLDEAGRGQALDALCNAHTEFAAAIRRHVDAASERSVAGGMSLVEAFREGRVAAAEIGRSIGSYTIVERLGGGAHGEVYLAEQSAPIQRRVAMKILRERAGSAEILARFEAERQALALLDHPAIAKILDAGKTDDGRPWFAMEPVVSARSITRYCADERTDLRGRLSLFAQVCDAVQHAHGRGILHRDLKPGNILCASSDGRPAPKVIDFGIAKATGGRLTELPFRTLAGNPIGTPVYASPEQARGALDVDVRTDVYALGAVLHELCCGEYPFAEHELARTWTEDRARFFEVVTGEEPEAPSRRLAARSEATPWGEDATELARACRGDIDAIVATALARARDSRYATVSELGADVRRVLAGEPVAARMPGIVARATRAVGRHRAVVVSAMVVAITLVLALLYTLRGNADLRRAEQDLASRNQELQGKIGELHAESARLAQRTNRLRREVREAEEVRLIQRHAAASLAGAEGDISLRSWVKRLVDPLDRGEQVWTPGVEAALRRTAAWISIGLGDEAAARDQLEGALVILSADDRDTRLEYAATAHALADGAMLTIGVRRSRELLVEALEIYNEELGAGAPESLAVAGDLAFVEVQSPNPLVKLAGIAKAIEVGRRLLFENGSELSQDDARSRFERIKRDLQERVESGDEAGARELIFEILEPVLAEPVLRSRLCNSLWAASNYDAFAPIAPLLLEIAIECGEREHGPGHDDVVEARSWLLYRYARRDLSTVPPDLAVLGRLAAHAVIQARLEEAVPWSRSVRPLLGKTALGLVVEKLREHSLLPSKADEFVQAARDAVELSTADVVRLRKAIE